ncbi:PorP/SprF family type IX secretion system membrane protein [Flavobacterium luminosum]|uniref:PorP/SprF family type IX secretion system membrane protein n=1 Tax=Flavobacterium luminosum TaxID=2949086 RepID=A0ABT0TRJ1_9FLAO|nr:PorP/SprF family type IX secretion system membrane protein [Flavobacterium sp. HXWNR70]MCL9809970.1 PorP/SprF family type IX secretion system membrane protein [Flavobacterium sp. HXWNR70]
MRKKLLSTLLFFNLFGVLHAQTTDGVVSFDLPIKNSLKFNKFLINPTFSFVREDESFISFTNKRQWMGFEDAPTTYFFSYSGKFRDQNGIGFGVFQRNIGVLTTFGAVGNFTRNVEINRDSNFSFGLNLAYVNSGLNEGKIITNESDPSLQNIAKNSLLTINPGINYSTGMIDLGLTANNIFYYNFNSSEMVSDDPMKSIAAHLMYTGYIYDRGFFENAKFSTILRGEMAKEKTILSGSVLLNAPKGIWAQAGYNSVYGASGGLGIILAKKISIGYTVEKGFGNFSNFGLTHEVTLAYKIKGYGDYEDAKPIVRATNKTNPYSKPAPVKKKSAAELQKEREALLASRQKEERDRLERERLLREKAMAEAKAKAEEAARLRAEREKAMAEARAKAEAEARAKAEADKNKALSEADRLRLEKAAAERARLEAEARAKAEAARKIQEAKQAEQDRLKAKVEADNKAKAEESARIKAEEAARIKAEQEQAQAAAKAKSEAEVRAKAEEAARLKAESEAKAKEEADRKAREAAEAKAKADDAARIKAEEASRIKAEQEQAQAAAKAKAEAEVRAKAEEAARLKAESEAKAKEEADRKAREAAEAKAKADETARIKAEEAARIKAEQEQAQAAAKAKADAEVRAKAEEAARLKAESEAKAKEEADRKAREAAEAKARADEAARIKAEEAARIKAEQEQAQAAAKAKADAEARAKAEETARLKAESEAKAKEEADRKAREAAEAKAKADEAARIKAEEAARIKAEQEQAQAAAKAKAEAEVRAKAEEAARLKAESEAKAKEEADRKAREAAEAKAKEEEAARKKAEAEAREKAREEERLRKEAAERAKLEANKTAEDKEIENLTQVIDDSKKIQNQNVDKFKALVDAKQRELLELRKENDLTEQGVVIQTKEVEFQSASAANRAIENLKSEISQSTQEQARFIQEFEALAIARLRTVPSKNDLINKSYAEALLKLKTEKATTDKQNQELIAKLDQIKAEIEVEKKRRIKRAQFDSTQDKYLKDRATLKQIKETTSPTGQQFKPTDFDYGDEDQANMQIVKNVENIQPGFYLVLAVHKDPAKRDEFLKKVIQAGQTNIDFFYNVATSSYYIYYQKFEEIDEATSAMNEKGSKPYNGKMVVVKVEK